jgi:tight adherence protein B
VVLAILVFFAVSGAIVGGYVAAIRLPGLLASRRLDARLKDLSSAVSDDEQSIVTQGPKSALPAFDRLVGGTHAASSLGKLIEQAGLQLSPGTVVVMCFGAGVCTAAIGFLLRPVWPAAAVGGVLGLLLPIGWLRFKRGVRFRRFEEQFPEALDLLSRAIRAGHAFQTAMGMVADELPPPVGIEFRKSFEQQNFGLPLKEALNGLSERVPLMDVRFFGTAVNIQRETGGNLAEILDNLAHVVRERFKILRQVRVHTAHGRFTGYVLLGLPAALAVALSFISPEHMRTLFTHKLGQTMVLGAIVMQTIGFVWIRRVIKIEV